MSTQLALLRRLQDSLTHGLRTSRIVETLGPFDAFFHPADSLIYLNYAVCCDQPDRDYLARVEDAFVSRGLAPRFENFEELWPTLGTLLRDNGFREEMRIPVMTLSPPDLIVPSRIDEVSSADTLEQIRVQEAVAGEAFGHGPRGEEAVNDAFDQIRAGLMRAALLDDSASGITVGSGPIVELAGVATRPSCRRKGAASAVSAWLCRRHFELGGELVWLSAGDDAARTVYSKLGFIEAGTQVNYIKD